MDGRSDNHDVVLAKQAMLAGRCPLCGAQLHWVECHEVCPTPGCPFVRANACME